MMRSAENDDRAKGTMAQYEDLRTLRSMYEQDWEDTARLIRPQRSGFGVDTRYGRKQQKPLNSEPIIANNSHAAGIYAAMSNPATPWVGLQTPDVEFNQWKPMAEWLDLATRRVRLSMSTALSTFYSTIYQAYADLSAFGNCASYDAVDPVKRRFIDVSVNLGEVVILLDANGLPIEWIRKYSLSALAAVREFGKDNLPDKIVDAAINRKSGDHTFYYHLMPNDEFAPGQIGPRGKRVLARTVSEDGQMVVREQGVSEMPSQYARWDVDSGMTYGTGPGFISLASARMLDQMDRATLRAAEYAADPTKLAPDQDAIPLNGVIRPGSVVYGAVDMQGRQLLQNMPASPSIGLTIEEKAQKVQAIKDAFNYSIMSLSGRTGVNEEEIMIMEEARLRNWAPHADRIMEELLVPKVERRFAMLWRMGQIPPPPVESEGLPLQVRYQSAAAMAMRAREGQAIRGFINDLAPLAQQNPRYLDRVDPDEMTEALHDARPTLPARILRSRTEADALAQQRQQQEQQVQQLQAAREGGQAARDFAQAANLAGLAPAGSA